MKHKTVSHPTRYDNKKEKHDDVGCDNTKALQHREDSKIYVKTDDNEI